MKLKAHLLDRAAGALEYFSTRTKEVKGEDGRTMLVQNPCTFSGVVTWDLASNEAALRDALAALRKARNNLLQKHIAAGMNPKEPSAAFLSESNALDETEYNVEIIMIPVDELKAEENRIPNSYRSAIRFMVDFGKKAKAAPVAEAA